MIPESRIWIEGFIALLEVCCLCLVPTWLYVCTSKDANVFQCAAAAVSGVRTAVSNVQTGVTELKTGVTELKTDSRKKNAAGMLMHYKLFMY